MDITECAASVCTDPDRVVWDTGHICADESVLMKRMRCRSAKAGMIEAGPTNLLLTT